MKRYTEKTDVLTGHRYFDEDANGDWVRAADAAQEISRLKAKNSALHNECNGRALLADAQRDENERLTAQAEIMAERIDLQTQWMLDHGITKNELGEILSKLAAFESRQGKTGND